MSSEQDGNSPRATPTPGLDQAPADRLAELIDLGTETIDQPEAAPAPLPNRRRVTLPGVIFSLVLAGMIAAVGWWSWRMVGMGGDGLQYTIDPNPIAPPPSTVPASPWFNAAVDTIPTDGQSIALEAVVNPEASKLAAVFSDGSIRIYPLQNGRIGTPTRLGDLSPYPLAVRFDARGDVGVINQTGTHSEHLISGELSTQPLRKPLLEVYHWDTQRMVCVPQSFDGGILIQRGAVQTRVPDVRFLGSVAGSGELLLADRQDRGRVGILDHANTTPRFIAAPDAVMDATLAPGMGRLVVVLGDGGIACLDVTTGETIWQREAVPGLDRPVAQFTPDGALFIAEHRLILVDPSDGKTIADLTPVSDLPLAVFEMRCSADGRHLLVLGNDLHLFSRER